MDELRRGPIELSWLRSVVLRGAIQNPRTKHGGPASGYVYAYTREAAGGENTADISKR